MKLEELRNIARERQIGHTGLSKASLIRKIQLAEGSFDCFASASQGECDQSECLWREDCFKEAGRQD